MSAGMKKNKLRGLMAAGKLTGDLGGYVGMVHLPSPAAPTLYPVVLCLYIKNVCFLLNIKGHEVTQSLEPLEMLMHMQ